MPGSGRGKSAEVVRIFDSFFDSFLHFLLLGQTKFPGSAYFFDSFYALLIQSQIKFLSGTFFFDPVTLFFSLSQTRFLAGTFFFDPVTLFLSLSQIQGLFYYGVKKYAKKQGCRSAKLLMRRPFLIFMIFMP